MKYKNKSCKKIKGSLPMIVSCGYCKKDIVSYQKEGRGGLINMYVNRIVSSEMDLEVEDKGLFCPNCKEQIGSRMLLKSENEEAYKMIRSSFNTRIING